ncbi:MAG TPA: GNAT family N-acetyltransferase [Blastocatellia bacterium]|nr:GNAT family N-acetyltransferase [Blastocatellia bacterium]
MRVEVLRDFPVSGKWADEWDALAARSAAGDAFVTYEWTRAAAEFDRNGRPLVICGYVKAGGAEGNEERLVGIAPLALRTGRNLWGRSTVIELVAGPWGDYCDVIAEPEYHTEFVERVVENVAALTRQGTCAKVSLNNLPDDSPTLNVFINKARALNLYVDVRPASVGPVLQIADADQAALDELLEKKGVVRKAKALAKKGKLEFRIVREPAEVRECLQKFYRLHTARYLINGRPSIYDPEKQSSLCRLLDPLAERLSRRGGVCLPALFFDGEPIALTLGFEHRGALALYAMTFDVGVMGTSPGEILVLEVARHCRAAGMRKLDFGIGDEGYKARFTNAQRQNCEVAVYRSGPAGRAGSVLVKAKAWAKRQPSLCQLIRRAKSFCQLARLEIERAGLVGAITELLRAKPDISLSENTSEIELAELRPRHLVDTILTWRRDLPSWEFRRAYELLRQGERCFIARQNNRAIRIVCQSKTVPQKKEAVGNLTAAPVPNLVPEGRRTLAGDAITVTVATTNPEP